MSALQFVRSLLESGRVLVPPAPIAPADLENAVRQLDAHQRPNLPPSCPALEVESGVWALLLLYRACQILVYREIEPDLVRRWLTVPCPHRPDAQVHFSVDLSFRFLPDLLKLARGIATDDPLVAGITALLGQWPLSSVGVKDLPALDAGLVIDDPALCRLYVDRVIENQDLSRLSDARVAEQVRAALGTHTGLAPRLAAALDQTIPHMEEVNARRA